MDPDARTEPGQGGTPAEGDDADPRRDSPLLGRELGGDLPCVLCGYNLRGLSIRGVCPECGAGVRATILSVVDPQAAVLRPINRPRAVAGGLVLWAAAAFAASAVCWTPHLVDALGPLLRLPALPDLSGVLIVLIALSGLGAVGLIRPHGGIPILYSVAAGAGVLLYGPMGWALTRLFRLGWPADGAGLRVAGVAMVSLAAIFILLRPNARLLVARSLLLRSGRVDRQTLFGMAAAALVVAIGHTLVVLAAAGGTAGNVVLRLSGVALLVVGGALVTLGLLGCVVDSVRIARAILRPRRSLREVLRGGEDPEAGGMA